MDNDSWIHPLKDLAYEPKLIEVTIPMSDKALKTDVVVQSRKHGHAIVFECKGGKMASEDQAKGYSKLTKKELNRFLDIHDLNQFTHDISYLDFQENHDALRKVVAAFPFLSLSKKELTKDGKFSKWEVEYTLADPISIDGKQMPVSYYPFSQNDSQGVIVKYVILAMIATLQDKRKRGLDVLGRDTYQNEDVMRSIHQMFKLMDREHQGELSAKAYQIVQSLQKKYNQFAIDLTDLQQRIRNGEEVHVTLSNLIKRAQEIIDKEEAETGLDQFQ